MPNSNDSLPLGIDLLSAEQSKVKRKKLPTQASKQEIIKKMAQDCRLRGAGKAKRPDVEYNPNLSLLRFNIAKSPYFFAIDNKVLGKGHLGLVKKAYPLQESHKVDEKNPFVRKRIVVKKSESETALALLQKQIDISWQLYPPEYLQNNLPPQPLVVPAKRTSKLFYEFENLSQNDDIVKVYCILPFAPGKTLLELFNDDEKDQFSYIQRLEIAIAVVEEVLRMHNLGFSHGELTTYNIMYDPDTKKATLVDFESANQKGKQLMHKDWGCNSFYAPPEFFSLQSSFDLSQAQKIDLYALGVTLTKLFYPADLLESFIGLTKEQDVRYCCGEHQYDWGAFNDAPENFCAETDKKNLKEILFALMAQEPKNRPDLNIVLGKLQKFLTTAQQNQYTQAIMLP